MSKAPKKNKKSDRDFIPLLYARNLEEAEYYQELLKEHAIPVLIDEEYAEIVDPATTEPGIPILVPDDHLDEAEAILEQEESLDDIFGNEEEDTDEQDEEEMEPLDPDVDYESNDILDDEQEDKDVEMEEEESF